MKIERKLLVCVLHLLYGYALLDLDLMCLKIRKLHINKHHLYIHL